MTKKPLLEVLTVITCLGALPLMVGLTGCASDRFIPRTGHRIDEASTVERGSSQSTEERIEDSRTAERVREALASGAEYKHDEVKVIACDGIVQLSGFVNTSAQRNSAGEIARKVAGVKVVENNLAFKD